MLEASSSVLNVLFSQRVPEAHCDVDWSRARTFRLTEVDSLRVENVHVFVDLVNRGIYDVNQSINGCK